MCRICISDLFTLLFKVVYTLYGSYQLYFSRNVEARTKGERRGERKECARDRGEKKNIRNLVSKIYALGDVKLHKAQ